jgi:tRNA ligase
MAIVVRVQSPEWEFTNKVPHITVGTISPDVKPKQSNSLLEEWLANDNGRDIGIHEAALQGVVVNATVQGVLSRL